MSFENDRDFLIENLEFEFEEREIRDEQHFRESCQFDDARINEVISESKETHRAAAPREDGAIIQ